MTFLEKQIKKNAKSRMCPSLIYIVVISIATFFFVLKSDFANLGNIMNSDPISFIILISAIVALLVPFMNFIRDISIYFNYKSATIYQKLLQYEGINHINKINEDYTNNNCVKISNNTMISGDYVLAFRGSNCYYNKTENLIWIYRNSKFTIFGKKNFINLMFNNHTSHTVTIRNEKEAKAMIQVIKNRYPNRIYGYNPDIRELYDNDINTLILETKKFK